MTARRGVRTVLAAGYCTLDVICRDEQIRHRAGGTAANVAANLAYLGWRAGLVVRLGYDAPARRILRDLQQSGVDTSAVERRRDTESPVVVHDVKPPTHRFLFTCPKCARKLPRYRPISEEHLKYEVLKARRPHVYFYDRAAAPAIHLAAEMRKQGVLVMFEPSAPGVAARTIAAAEGADIVKCSHDRRKLIDGALLTPRTGQLQIETLGPDGLRYRVGHSHWERLPAIETEVVDSGGAGDWLTAAFLTSMPALAPTSLTEAENALRRAQAFAALSCRFVGARSLATESRRLVDRAITALLDGVKLELPTPARERRSRARNVCELCLGPARAPEHKAARVRVV